MLSRRVKKAWTSGRPHPVLLFYEGRQCNGNAWYSPRYKPHPERPGMPLQTMRVPGKAQRRCGIPDGLPIELGAEKECIIRKTWQSYVEEYNKKCREAVMRVQG